MLSTSVICGPRRSVGPSAGSCVFISPLPMMQVMLRIVGLVIGSVSSGTPLLARVSPMLSPSMHRLPSSCDWMISAVSIVPI